MYHLLIFILSVREYYHKKRIQHQDLIFFYHYGYFYPVMTIPLKSLFICYIVIYFAIPLLFIRNACRGAFMRHCRLQTIPKSSNEILIEVKRNAVLPAATHPTTDRPRRSLT
jgi:hypothetical protein